MRVLITAFLKTSHGPAKSRRTAPSEMRKATGMLPSAGGFSGFRIAAGVFKLSDRAEVANVSLARACENAATKPNAADFEAILFVS